MDKKISLGNDITICPNCKKRARKRVYKYKALRTKEDLIRLIDIFRKHRLYMPKYKQLNDPLESQATDASLGICGESISEMANQENTTLKRFRNEYNILSLTESCRNPQMWAHYGDNYKGVCLCFSADEASVFSKCSEVSYVDVEKIKRVKIGGINSMDVEHFIYESFFKKHIGWSYEKELRIVEKCENSYFEFSQKDLLAVIFGHRMSEEIKLFIQEYLDHRLKKYKTAIGYRSFGIDILDFDYQPVFDGSKRKSVDLE